ncbi:MAG: S-adenosylmethionine:tRNA ribosyltransferase-isomerase [Cyclobacteriaceae bacterium]
MDLKLDDFLYELPEEKIAKHPLQDRADSKLLHYDQGEISHHTFDSIVDLIPQGSLLMFNNTRVIPARVIMHKDTGAKIEIFLLEPLLPSTVHEEVMNSQRSSTWRCMIGNAKKWKMGTSLVYEEIGLKTTRISEDQVTFEWSSDFTFSDLLIEIGKIPLPPYINREPEKSDEERYQTVYSKMQGAVAAPTAGLHFTDEVISTLEKKKIQTDYLTLHVSAGTFQPIKEQKITEHPMHNEQIWISRQNVEHLLTSDKVIAVGTTSMRTIESLYWFGVQLLNGNEDFFIRKEDAYTLQPVSKEESLQAVLNYMSKYSIISLQGQTEIFIYPGYEFRLCEGLVTNFHLPGSTLILLVAAFIGEDWRKVYENALVNDYRFLSYGDSSLLLP